MTTWKDSRTRKFSIKSVYWRANGRRFDRLDSYQKPYKVHERFKLLHWRLAQRCLPVRDRLALVFGPISVIMVRIQPCLHCHLVRFVWFGSKWNLRMEGRNFSSGFELVK